MRTYTVLLTAAALAATTLAAGAPAAGAPTAAARTTAAPTTAARTTAAPTTAARTTGSPTTAARTTGSPTTAAPTAAAPAARVSAAGQQRLGPCDTGQLCLWPKKDFRGARQAYELAGVDVESCVALPAGTAATALANRTGRPVTTYQSAECAETGEFETYPGGGTWVPESPYRVRAFKVWES
ncbi:peptidase inhibitor family I36 protein [Streptomyces sp. NPDC093595]|uniref:peptidase inhibitor family I36 protein n=1 Tax=Streptomyces sp. NPDC093595 TaxID=3366045 RepID=UPI0038306AAF